MEQPMVGGRRDWEGLEDNVVWENDLKVEFNYYFN